MDYEDLGLTEKQEKAAKAVYRAMRKAATLNVKFWDDYGTLSCYSGNNFRGYSMEADPGGISYYKHPEIAYHENLTNFAAGNADDELWLMPH